jgi:hypothetical protein
MIWNNLTYSAGLSLASRSLIMKNGLGSMNTSAIPVTTNLSILNNTLSREICTNEEKD